jgi:restriction system protein
MAVPDFQTVMRPMLGLLADGNERPITAIRAELAEHFELTTDDLAERIPSGRVTTFQNRVGWAATHLYNTKLIARPRRAVYVITDRGKDVLGQHPDRVDLRVLAQFEEFAKFRGRSDGSSPAAASEPDAVETALHTPEEQIEEAFGVLKKALADELLDRISEQTPAFFEQLVLDVLHAMGYGGVRGTTERLGQSGDGGVDGVIREDPLGLDLIYVQAKRWANVVGRPEIQKFFGALHGRRATKGVFITTSTFSREAIDYADGVTPRVILVDGAELAQLMIEHAVGVTSARRYDIKRLDLDYFVTDDDEPTSAVAPEVTVDQ